ncbi:TonB family protein [Citrobacter sp. CK184]|uniref:TonB family protein n=1 Tax=unclassified Citrobacter TaxID=2644389 RepID=UPI0025758696|nr:MULTISPECIES: TonB family protein [unclassified Citrobacter]MDM3030178.1 TonB family protein [Citrobacter sp. CK185]MDM3048754.1 TonB family protein [Citrobacter sp. CK184]
MESNQPKQLTSAFPTYPYYAMANRIEGFVEVKYDIGSDGRISKVWIMKSEPQHLFDSSVISAMSKWRYEKDKPTRGMTKNIKFKLRHL